MHSEYVGRLIRIDWLDDMGSNTKSVVGTCTAMAFSPAPSHPDVEGPGYWVFMLREHAASARVTTVYIGDHQDVAIRAVEPDIVRAGNDVKVAP